ncbi:MAG: hypothetical protein FGM15_02820 [Chthoniobacterales bacterium]|nr:hypothetical protein [Chthoniobacterales bacterium]
MYPAGAKKPGSPRRTPRFVSATASAPSSWAVHLRNRSRATTDAMPDGPVLIVTLFAAGLILVAAEVFLPGAILGILGGLCFVVSVALVFAHYGSAAGLAASFAVVVLGASGFMLWLYLFPRSFVGRRIILRRSENSPSASAGRRDLVGAEGIALTPLRPAGTARFDGKRIDVSTDGEFLAEGEKVVVVAADGMRTVVRQKERLEHRPESA